jgi:hypothetical protein
LSREMWRRAFERRPFERGEHLRIAADDLTAA